MIGGQVRPEGLDQIPERRGASVRDGVAVEIDDLAHTAFHARLPF